MNRQINLILSGAVSALTLAGFLTSCDKTPADEIPILPDNRIEYSSEITEIHSALYTEENGEVSIYLTPRRGVRHIENMKAEDDYVCLTADAMNGAMSPSGQWVFSYRSAVVDPHAEERLYSSAEISSVLSGSSLDFSADVVMKSGLTVKAYYNGAVAMPEEKSLNNQYRIGSDVFSIGSVVEVKGASKSVLYVYEEEGQTYAPAEGYEGRYYSIEMANDYLAELSKGVDLSRADNSRLSVKIGDTELVSASGRLRITPAKSGKDLTVALSATKDGTRYETAYYGGFIPTYPIDCQIIVTGADGEVLYDNPLEKVFVHKSREGYKFGFGCLGKAALVDDLKNMYYAYELFVINPDKGNSIVGVDNDFVLNMCDNTVPERVKLEGKGISGHIFMAKDPQGVENGYHIDMEAVFGNGIAVTVKWNGVCTVEKENFDLLSEESVVVPEPNGEGIVTIYDTDGSTIIKQVLVMDVQHKVQNTMVSGVRMDVSYFYFMTEESNGNPTAYMLNPELRFEPAIINAGRMTIPLENNEHYYVRYTDDLGLFGFIQGNTLYQGKRICPTAGELEVSNNGEEWDIYLRFKNEVPDLQTDTLKGNHYWYEFKWKGKVSPM